MDSIGTPEKGPSKASTNAHRPDLSSVLTSAEPLGPIAHEWIIDTYADDLIDDQISLFRDVSTKPHMLFLGRKGAGKSALLAEIRLTAMRKRRGVLVSDELPPRGGQFVLPVLAWQHFHQIVKSVSRRGEDEILADLIPPEHFIELWKESLWDEIITYFYDYAHHDESRHRLEPVDHYVNATAPGDAPPRQAAERLFHNARRAVIDFLDDRNAKLYFLFDSMDNYPVRSATFAGILSGLFQALTAVSHETPRIIISFCMPEEVENFLVAGSSNLMKDFSSSFRIRWKPIDLIKIVAHRLRVSARIHDQRLYGLAKDLDFNVRGDLHRLFSEVLPSKITNAQGHDEDALAYVIRHTQLLPRHVLAIFNAALSEQLRTAGSYRGMSEDVLRKGVGDVQRAIADQILIPYKRLYPKLLAEARRILPDTDPICDYQTLRRLESRFERLIEDDVGSVWHTLFEMGVLGRSTSAAGGEHHNPDAGRYCYGQFHFNAEMGFGFATDGEYCFHPVFSRAFGMTRRKADPRVVYPANIDLDHLYAE